MNLVYAWCVQRIEPEKLAEWQAMLAEPLPHQMAAKAEPTPFQAEDEGEAFMATMAMHSSQVT
jgi:hypothetical protein